MTPVTKLAQYLHYHNTAFHRIDRCVPGEALVELNVNGEGWLTFTCTPQNVQALAVGFLFNEGVIQSSAEIASLHLCAAGDLIDVWLTHPVEKPREWTRTSGCGGGSPRSAIPTGFRSSRLSLPRRSSPTWNLC